MYAELKHCTDENHVAIKLRDMSKRFERWARIMFGWILGAAIFECIAAVIAGFVIMTDGETGVFAVFFLGAVGWFLINLIVAMFIRFILNCISLNYLAKGEQIQCASESAAIAFFTAKNIIEE